MRAGQKRLRLQLQQPSCYTLFLLNGSRFSVVPCYPKLHMPTREAEQPFKDRMLCIPVKVQPWRGQTKGASVELGYELVAVRSFADRKREPGHGGHQRG